MKCPHCQQGHLFYEPVKALYGDIPAWRCIICGFREYEPPAPSKKNTNDIQKPRRGRPQRIYKIK